MVSTNFQLTVLTRDRYQRIAKFYDFMETLPERKYHLWRKKLWSFVQGPRVLEVGVGTGRNIPFSPRQIAVTGIDITPAMLNQAAQRAAVLGVTPDLRLGDVQKLTFSDASFDNVVATFVFCSVPDAILGLREVKRVLKMDGKLFLLEHVRSSQPVIGRAMDILNPLTVRIMGVNINRKTIENVQLAGLVIEHIENLDNTDIFKLIIARPD
ncbi:MAG: methyltransferase domain-containing protein [Anaerolineales bacterium]|nr:methyltransferase domain-containing protein [Anaerolineales bacterium]